MGHELCALANQGVRTLEIRMGDRSWHNEDVPVLFECEARGRERAGTLWRFNDQHALRKAAHDAIAFEETVRKRGQVGRIF